MSHTVKSWAQYWTEHYDQPNVRPTTLAAHRYLMENHIIPGRGGVLLAELTEEKVGAFLEEVQLHGNHRPETKCYPLMTRPPCDISGSCSAGVCGRRYWTSLWWKIRLINSTTQ